MYLSSGADKRLQQQLSPRDFSWFLALLCSLLSNNMVALNLEFDYSQRQRTLLNKTRNILLYISRYLILLKCVH